MEYLDIVDEADRVIGSATRDEVYRKFYRHRIVHILLFDRQNRMLLQMRHRTKSYCPLHWSTAVGGHVQAGEEYEESAHRECYEELGIAVGLEFLDKRLYHDPERPGLSKYLATFRCEYEGPFQHLGCDEVESVEYFPLDSIQKMRKEGSLFHPELRFLLDVLPLKKNAL